MTLPTGFKIIEETTLPKGFELVDESWGVEDTLRSAGAVLGGFAAMPVAGIGGLYKLVTSGDLNEASKTMEGISSIPSEILTTERQKQAAGKAGELISKPFVMAGEGWRLIGKETGIPYAEPILGTLGEAAGMVAVGGAKGAIKGRMKGRVKGDVSVPKGFELEKAAEDVKVEPTEIVQPGATSIEKPPITEVPKTEPVIDGTESKLAIRAEARAIEAKLTEDFGGLVEYNKEPGFMKAQAELAAEVLAKDYESAKRMAMGNEKVPEGIRPATMYEAVKIKALKDGDVDTLQSLATESKIPTMLSEYGKEIKAADSRVMDDPVKIMQDIGDARAETAKRTGTPKAKQATIEKLRLKVEELNKQLEDIEPSKAIAKIKNEIDLEQRQTKRVYKKEELAVEFTSLSEALAKSIKSQSTFGAGLPAESITIIGKMARNRVQSGIITVEGVVDSIYTEVKNLGIKLSEREIRDAISGYGRYKLLSKDEISVKLRDLKGQMQQISKLEDLESRQPPLKTGVERRIPSDEERKLISQVNELKKKYGIQTVDTETQLKSSLDAIKTRLKNEIKEFENELSTGKFSDKNRNKVVRDTEAVRLQNERDRYKQAHDVAVKSAGKVTREEAAKIVEMSKEVTEARLALEQGGDRFAYGSKKVAFENYVNSLKGRELPILKAAQERVAEFKTTWKGNPSRAVYEVGVDVLKQITDNSIAMVATLDNSFMGRQGFKTLMTHYSAWWDGAKNSFIDFAKTIGGKNAHDALMADIYSRPNYLNGEYQTAKIIAKMEEQYPATLPERLPGVGRVFRASEYAFTGSALRMRTDLYDLLSKRAKEGGVVWDKKHIEDAGKLINSLTARGQWGKRGEPAIVRMILWAPKMLKGNLDVLTMHNLGAGLETSFARKQAALNLTKIIAETATIMIIANALKPGSAELDPRSSDFGKIKVGKTRFDITGGAGSIVVLASRIATRASKSSVTKKITKYGTGFGKQDPFDALIDFLTNKTSPPARVVVDYLRGEQWGGKKFTWSAAMYNAATPIALQNIIDLKNGASADKIAGVIADGLGISANTYEPFRKK